MRRLEITSSQNPQIKQIVKLHKASRARKAGVFICEGARLIGRALDSGYELEQIICSEDLLGGEDALLAQTILQSNEIAPNWLDIPDFLYNSMSYRDNGCGLMGIFKRKDHSLSSFRRVNSGFYIILEAPEKPGNIGAVCRCADAAGAAGMIVCDVHTDPYNPNALTSSTGAIFSTPLAFCTADELINWLGGNSPEDKITLLAAVCGENSQSFREIDFNGPVAIAIGREHEGLSENLADAADKLIHIPMHGQVDSLNASTAAAIIMFEAAKFFNF